MNRDQKAAVIEEVAAEIQGSEAVFAVDYRGISVTQAAELRNQLTNAEARLRVVKNTLTERAADKAGAEALKELLEGPTALTFVKGDVALAAKAIATFRRQNEVPQFKGGTMNGESLSIDQLEALARLPSREALQAQFVGVLASPITGLVRGLAGLISGLASQLKQIEEQGLVGGSADAAPASDGGPQTAEAEAPAEEAPAAEAEAPAPEETPEPEAEAPSEAPGDPVAEGEAAAEAEAEAAPEAEAEAAPEAEETATETEAPSEGDTEQEG